MTRSGETHLRTNRFHRPKEAVLPSRATARSTRTILRAWSSDGGKRSAAFPKNRRAGWSDINPPSVRLGRSIATPLTRVTVSAVWSRVNHQTVALAQSRVHNYEFTTRHPPARYSSAGSKCPPLHPVTAAWPTAVNRISSPTRETDLSRSRDWVISLIPVTNDSISVVPLGRIYRPADRAGIFPRRGRM